MTDVPNTFGTDFIPDTALTELGSGRYVYFINGVSSTNNLDDWNDLKFSIYRNPSKTQYTYAICIFNSIGTSDFELVFISEWYNTSITSGDYKTITKTFGANSRINAGQFLGIMIRGDRFNTIEWNAGQGKYGIELDFSSTYGMGAEEDWAIGAWSGSKSFFTDETATAIYYPAVGDIFSTSNYTKQVHIYATGTYDDTVPPIDDPGFPGEPGGGGAGSNDVPETCRNVATSIYPGEWYTGWGNIKFNSWVSTSSPVSGSLTIRRPWETSGGTTQTTVDSTTYTWSNPSDATEKYSIDVDFGYFTGSPDNSKIYSIYECWWHDYTTTDMYVAPNGSNGNSGTSASPKRDISAAFNGLAPNGTIHVRSGQYPDETALAPLTPGKVNIEIYNQGWTQDSYQRCTLSDSGVEQLLYSQPNATNTGISLFNTSIDMNTISNTGIIEFIDVATTHPSYTNREIVLKRFRSDGTYFRYLGETTAQLKQVDYSDQSYRQWHYYVPLDEPMYVEAGDRIGWYMPAGGSLASQGQYQNGNYWYSGNRTSDLLIADATRVSGGSGACKLRTML